jgi:hypothetical protein
LHNTLSTQPTYPAPVRADATPELCSLATVVGRYGGQLKRSIQLIGTLSYAITEPMLSGRGLETEGFHWKYALMMSHSSV